MGDERTPGLAGPRWNVGRAVAQDQGFGGNWRLQYSLLRHGQWPDAGGRREENVDGDRSAGREDSTHGSRGARAIWKARRRGCRRREGAWTFRALHHHFDGGPANAADTL